MESRERFLRIFLRLQEGQQLSKIELAEEYSVDLKTIQRDFSLLKNLSAEKVIQSGSVDYNYQLKKYEFNSSSLFNKRDVLAIAKIILENRAFSKGELTGLLNGLLGKLTKDDRIEVERIIKSEWHSYHSVSERYQIDKIWEISDYIRQEKMLRFYYKRPVRQELKAHDVLPVAIYYDKHYFYLKAFDLGYDKYVDFRLDRIKEYGVSKEDKPRIDYRHKFHDGEERNQKVDAFSGALITVRIRYTADKNIILDEFPLSKIISEKEGVSEIELTVQDTLGLERKLLSQMDNLVVLSPLSLVKKIEERLTRMQKNYKNK